MFSKHKQSGFQKNWFQSGLKYWYLFILSVIPFLFITDLIQFVIGGISFFLSDLFLDKVIEDMKSKGFKFKD